MFSAGYNCHTVSLTNGLVGIAITDLMYPSRVAINMLNTLIHDFEIMYGGERWRTAIVDNSCKFYPLEAALKEYQTPEKIDVILKIHASLDDTKGIIVRIMFNCLFFLNYNPSLSLFPSHFFYTCLFSDTNNRVIIGSRREIG